MIGGYLESMSQHANKETNKVVHKTEVEARLDI